ncbi:MAG: hypothetical protein FJZ64_03900, partial [Chlamydiae bacterium]|nr:hypothetical protein [Chlamydiota bacterium]
MWVLDFLFPPLCKCCKEPCKTKLLCPACWEMAMPVDPVHRCVHCFKEVEEEGICLRCKAFVFEWSESGVFLKNEVREHPEVIAAFLLLQWEKLNWKRPDAIAYSKDAKKIASIFGTWLHIPALPLLKKRGGILRCEPSFVDEDANLLLLMKESCEEEEKKTIDALLDAFPKEINLLKAWSGQSNDCPESGEES